WLDGLLRQPHRDGTLRRDLARDPLRLLEPRLFRDDARDEAAGPSLVRGEEATGEGDVHRPRPPAGPRESLRAARARHDAEVDLRLPELRGLRGDDQVARHRELAAAAEAIAGDGRNERRAQHPDRVPLVDAPVRVELDRSRA